ncbi:TPA: helix-turn-helix domain-containing protein [Vibrio parahaemolyticus]|nr:helix-turn-helix domain-containing protein [Vibrio parahaemolyticus]
MSMRITPKQKAEVIALLEAGFSKSASARKVGVSLSTVKRIASDPKVKPGKNHSELVAAARESLLCALSSDFVTTELASLIIDNRAIASALKDEVAVSLDEIRVMKASNLKEVGAKTRALAAAATTYKLMTDAERQILAYGAPQVEVEELPVLTVTEMLGEEINFIRERQDRDAVEAGLIIKAEGDEAV